MAAEPSKPGLTDYDNANVCAPGEVATSFATGKTIPEMHAMMQDAKPEEVIRVADAWERLHQRVAGGDGIKNQFDKAVDHILQHWEGDAADQFAKRAKRVSKSLQDCGTYAQYTGMAMATAGETLKEIKPAVLAIEAPSKAGSVMDRIGDGFTRNDDEWRKDISKNQGAQNALDGHDGDLSAGREEQLKAAAKMEQLAVVYSGQTKMMGSWGKRPKPDPRNEHDEYPGDPGGVAPAPIPVAPGGSGTGRGGSQPPSRRSPSGTGKGSATSPPTKTAVKTPGAGTEVNAITGGTGTSSTRGATPNLGGGTGATTVGGGNSGGLSGGMVGASGIGTGNGRTGGPGMVGRASGNRGTAGTGARAGFAGNPGNSNTARGAGALRGGIGSGSGNAGNGSSSSAGRGPLARQKGGALDTPQAGKSSERQGGSGLHSSRGGAAAGQRGQSGMLGAAGKNTDRRKGDSKDGHRPDYLVEDEETWLPKRRDVAPPNIG